MDKKQDSIVHNFNQKSSSIFSPLLLLGVLAVIILGIGTGFVISNTTTPKTVSTSELDESSDVEKGMVVGSNDTKTFKDTTEGVLKEGGVDGEGQYHLVRPGGESQNVYLTSSLVDLSLFVDKKIKVWGQTQTAQKVGWLMDVGKVEVL